MRYLTLYGATRPQWVKQWFPAVQNIHQQLRKPVIFWFDFSFFKLKEAHKKLILVGEITCSKPRTYMPGYDFSWQLLCKDHGIHRARDLSQIYRRLSCVASPAQSCTRNFCVSAHWNIVKYNEDNKLHKYMHWLPIWPLSYRNNNSCTWSINLTSQVYVIPFLFDTNCPLGWYHP